MKIYIKYCDNADFLRSFPDKFFNFLYIDPPYNTRLSDNKSYQDNILKINWYHWMKDLLQLYIKKTNYTNTAFISLGRNTFNDLNRLLASIQFTYLPKNIFLWKTCATPTMKYQDNYEYIASYVKRSKVKGREFYANYKKHIIEYKQKWTNLQKKIYSSSKLNDFEYIYKSATYRGFNCPITTLNSLNTRNLLTVRDNTLWGFLNTPKYDKMSRVISDKDINYKLSNKYQLNYLNNDPQYYFSFPKPWELIYKLLKYHYHPDYKNVCDFFAGSGSTADAIVRFNVDFKCELDCYLCEIQPILKKHHIIRFTWLFNYLNITDYKITEDDNTLIINYKITS